MVVCRRRPPTAKGFAFLTLEDVQGMVNVVVPPRTYDKWKAASRNDLSMIAEGVLEHRGGVNNVRAARVVGMRDLSGV